MFRMENQNLKSLAWTLKTTIKFTKQVGHVKNSTMKIRLEKNYGKFALMNYGNIF